MKSAHQILVEARELLSVPERWTKDEYARDPSGEAVMPLSERAVCWCTIGAMYRIAGAHGDELRKAKRALERATQDGAIAVFNDDPSRTHAEILAAFDRAIEATR